ncbi:M6 family metalloprotease domain-containing protein [Dysgonomonas sp. 520]|uniref:M6 family metalloprotease domain-containing protein n=1 Tax=Dysgonomonas sp. 520 TaxID=2302931 RepID=UPI0013D5948F|nr:M6 family metalloprotease domain-containing protein [Dysgonomonas sp. 520]NDW09673.1 M6 family metalloprotease domain-containing protein [Dysgonomonas sp. 520]
MRYITLFVILTSFVFSSQAQQNKGELANLVCFVRFADEDESIFDQTITHYEQLFNNEETTSASVYNYFWQASYGQLKWKSVMYPLANNTTIVSYKAQKSRNYYLHKTSINPEGYDENNATDALSREQNLVKEITDYMETIIPSTENLDKNNDGVIDNITLIISGNSEISNRYMMWPHRSTLYIIQGSIHEKRVNEYILLFADGNGWSNLSPTPLNAGVLCHEMSHTLGTRDLYHNQKGLSPIGTWDLMSDNLQTPQGMSAYTKYKYCKWIDEIPEISTPGTYTLNPVGGNSKENIAYKIKPTGSSEYFVLEYRKKDGPFESGIPSSGLLVYRINPNFTGNENYDGISKFDEQYLFRKNGTTTSDGNISQAAFSQESGRVAFGGSASEKPFYTDGREAQFAISNVSSCGETISFDLLPFSTQIHPSLTTISLNGNQGSSTSFQIEAVNTDWQVKSKPDWLEVSPLSGNAGSSTLTVTTNSRNNQAAIRDGKLIIESTSNNAIFATIDIFQKSDIIQPPHGLTAEETDNKIALTWKKPLEGTPTLTEDFENIANKGLWTFKTENNVGWVWQESEKYKLPYEGKFSARLNSEMQDRHQDEWLISPAFANGSTLIFYSNSIAPGKTNAHNFYYVKVSKDGGNSWENVYDLKTQSSTTNKYERIVVDLSAHQSDNMKIAFHAYDDNNEGLSYWWHVDNIAIYPTPSSSIVKGYHIYRNGEKIGSSQELLFTDESPLNGENIYAVKAVGDFGETPLSDSVTIEYDLSGIGQTDADEIKISISDSHINILSSEGDIQNISLYNLNGNMLYENKNASTSYDISTSILSKGVYIIRLFRESKSPQSYKILIK